MPDLALTYQYIVTGLLILWIVPLITVWVRYDSFPHRIYIIVAVVIWPLTLWDEVFRAFGAAQNYPFLLYLFQFVPLLLCILCLLASRKLLFEKPLRSSWKYYLPLAIMVVAQLPLLLMAPEARTQIFSQQATGELLVHWVVYLPYLFSGFAILILCIQALEWLGIYHMQLSEQVVDVHLYRFRALRSGYIALLISALLSISLTAMALFDVMGQSLWQSTVNLIMALTFYGVMMMLMESRRYSPSPFDPQADELPHFSEEDMRSILRKAEVTVVEEKQYKRIGLRLRQLANSAGVDPIALALATRTILNRNFRAFIYHYRLEYAKQVLMRSDTKISTVARRLGFSSEKFLSNVFVRYIRSMGRRKG